jgi:hypothetical protein
MAIKDYALRDVMKLLKEAAKRKSVVTYGELWRIFDRVDSEGDQWDTLEEAVRRISDPNAAIYGALMSAKGTGLPGNGFYRTFRDERLLEYERMCCDKEIEELTDDEKRALTDFERGKVYEHAKRDT